MYSKLLIATDGSPTAERAAQTGAEVAEAVGADVLLLHVGDPQAGKLVLEQGAKALGAKLKVEARTVAGDPADKIVEIAEREAVDLIVVGNKGMTGAKRFLLGSVPNQVSHHAPCNVLIVKTT